jgi:hypothetical protein
MEVMPIWIVERKRFGSSPSFMAAAAAPSPSSMSFCRRTLRAVRSANSDMAKTPLKRISAISKAISMVVGRWGNQSGASTPAASRNSTRVPSAMRYSTNGMYPRVDTSLRNQTMTA